MASANLANLTVVIHRRFYDWWGVEITQEEFFRHPRERQQKRQLPNVGNKKSGTGGELCFALWLTPPWEA